MSIRGYRHPDLVALEQRIRRDVARFEAADGKVEVLPAYGHPGAAGLRKASYNGRATDGTPAAPQADMSLYYTESDIVSLRGKRGILPCGRTGWRNAIRLGVYQEAHAHISGSVPLWRRDYIDSIAAEIAAKRGAK